MAKYTKDDINFHGFLAATRKMQKRSVSKLARGLYSDSMLARIEKGERLPKKLERDRIVARLGVSGEGYEDYLSREEYAEWVLRQDILKSVEEKDVVKLEEQLAIFESGEDITKVELQFLEAMRFMLLSMKQAPEDELRKVIELAVSYTIPNIEEGFPKKLLLADQEINLLIEYVNLHTYGETDEECHAWRLARYEDIITYIEQSCIDDIGKAKVYPKLVYYICQEFANGKGALEEMERSLELCNDAIEVLRDTRKMYYLVELLELRQAFIARRLEEYVGMETAREEELRVLSATSKEWRDMLVELYMEYDVSPYMENFCYLYLETESHCVNDVIRIRRKMLGLTQAALAENICAEKTVGRIEKKVLSPQMYDIRGLFGKLGLCPEYVRANVITIDPEVMALHMRLNKHINGREYEEWEASLEELESKLCLDIIQNRQIVMKERNLLEYCRGEKSKAEYIECAKDILKFTVPVDRITKFKEWYLTNAELTGMHSMAVRIDEIDENPYFEMLRKHCMEEIEMDQVNIRIGVDELIITSIANTLGSMGIYKESNFLSEKMMNYSLRNRRMPTLAKNIYNKLWNDLQVASINFVHRDGDNVNNILHKCILLCDIAKSTKFKDFFESKLRD